MNDFLSAIALFLLLNMAAGLVRIWRGPTGPDRMLGTLLFGSTGTAMLLVLAQSSAAPALRDVALVLALLAATTTVVYVRRWKPPSLQPTRER